MRPLFVPAVVVLLLGCLPPPLDAPDAGGTDGAVTDAGAADAGREDSGTQDSGVTDAGSPDAGEDDAGLPDAGDLDGGPPDAGGPRVLGLVPTVATDAGMLTGVAGYGLVDLTSRGSLVTTQAATLDGGFAVAISRTSLVLAEGDQCRLSFVNSYHCDYRWFAPDGGVLASVTYAHGLPHPRGEVMVLYRDDQLECPDPVFVGQSLRSARQALVDVDTGALRIDWPRSERSGLTDVGPRGDLVADPRGGRSCDAGTLPNVSALTVLNRVRPPYEKLFGVASAELGDERLLVIDGGYEVALVEADGGARMVAPRGASTSAEVQRDTFTLQRDRGYYRGPIASGLLVPLVTLTGTQRLTTEGGRFATVIEPPDYGSRIVIDSMGVVPDLRYPIDGQLLERAPLLVGRDASNHLAVGRLDQGTWAVAPFTAPFTSGRVAHFPDDDAAIVIDSQRGAWLVDETGVNRLTDDAVHLPFRSFLPAAGAPNVVLLALRPVSGGPYELIAVDRRTRRLVTLSRKAFVNPSASYLRGCDVPGLLTPGHGFFFFAETTAVSGQIDLYLAPSSLTEAPRLVGTTLAAGCAVPVVARDGSRVAVQETLGGPTTVRTADW